MTRPNKTIVSVIAIVALLNLLYVLFFFTRVYEESVYVSTQINVDSQTIVWYVYKNKYSEERIFSDRLTILPNQTKNFELTINTKDEIDYIGLFWNAEIGSSIELTSYSYNVNDKSYIETNPRRIIHYTNSSSFTKSQNNGIKITSSDSKRNWIILNDTNTINEQRDEKAFRAIPIVFNLLLISVIFFFRKKTSEIFSYLRVKPPLNLKNVRLGLLSIWVFIMPYWIIVSHTLMAVTAAISIYELFSGKSQTNTKFLKTFALFFLLFFGIVVTSFFVIPQSQLLDTVLSNLYFLLIPFSLIGITSASKTRLIQFFKAGIYSYLILLILYTCYNYYVLETDYDLFKFLELNLELFWHTSYFSALLLILFIYKTEKPIKNNFNDLIFYAISLAFMFIINARLPFLVGILLIAVRLFKFLKRKLFRGVVLITTICFIAFLFISFLGSKPNTNIGNINSIDARLSIWEASFVQIKENILLGVGSKNTVEAISKSMKEEYKTKYRNYNAHNQFIEILLSNGVFIFILFLIFFIKYFFDATDYGKIFIISCLILFMVESYLQRQSGIIYFTFWAAFFSNFNGTKNE